MALVDYEHDMQRCSRCSYCKWVPYQSWRNLDFVQGCPAVSRYNWHAYSSSGKLNMAYSLLHKRIDYSEEFLNIIYRCQMDGSCDISCKAVNDIEPLQCMQELRIKCIDDGQLLPQHMPIIDSLRKEDNTMLGKRSDRGRWADGLAVKKITEDRAEVYFHTGCRYCYDEQLWPQVRSALNILLRAGVNVGIAGQEENCCAGRAYEIGYQSELTKYAENNLVMLKQAGVNTIVTACADCYHAFKVLYPKIMGPRDNLIVLHITEYLDQLLREGKIKPTRLVPMTVTYHDPCHLGRLGEPWIHWNGKLTKVLGQMIVHDPPKKYRRGTHGVYEPPRNILKNLPGLNLIEMSRNRESAWCCGAGGGTIDAFPEFSHWTAAERLREAKATGAEAIVTACPWCKRNFLDTIQETGDKIKVLDIMELLTESIYI